MYVSGMFGNTSFTKSAARTQVYNNSGRTPISISPGSRDGNAAMKAAEYNRYIPNQKQYAKIIGVR